MVRSWTVRRGITRTVLLTRRWAVKVPSLRAHGDGLTGVLWSIARGLLANQAEIEWRGYEAFRDRTCPIRWHGLGGLVVVMPRCDPLIVGVDIDEDGVPLAEMPKIVPNPGDNKPQNYGRLGGRIVRLDYDMSYNGCPHDRSGAQNRALGLS